MIVIRYENTKKSMQILLPGVFQDIRANAVCLFIEDWEKKSYELDSQVPISYNDALPQTYLVYPSQSKAS